LAFVLFAVDLFVPSAGTLTIGGLISFVLGSYLLIGEDAPAGYEIAPAAIWTMTACLLAFSLFLGAAVLRARLRPPVTGRQALIGAVGTVRRPLAPRGVVFLNGELWDATLDAGGPVRVEEGAAVTVTRLDGLRVTVRPATEAEQQEMVAEVGVDRRMVIPLTGPAGAEAPTARV
jgi:membrane-bound serine protease (ClpP class)